MKVLAINTYGGSLLLGATQLGCEIIGSYEDTGFGTPIQLANFPHLDIRPMRKDWPAQDLSEVFVIAHPPCSAFSVQTQNPARRGTDSDAFACTRQVLQYAVNNNALGVAVESVVGALAGAWQVHQHYADTYGYNIYRVLQNGCMFGAQWRDRFWVVYLRRGAAAEQMTWTLRPQWRTVRQVVGRMDGEDQAPVGMDEALQKLRSRFTVEAGCTADELGQIFGPNPDELCSVDDRLWRLKFPTEDRWEVCKRYVTKYASSAMIHLAPDGLCPVLLGGSWWYLDGRNLSEAGYKRLMGFPDSYVFPEEGRHRAEMRTYLSKGVMPQVATWVLAQVEAHLGLRHEEACPCEVCRAHEHSPSENGDCRYCGDGEFGYEHRSPVEPYQLVIGPNEIADFRIRKKTWRPDNRQRPPLRHEDDRPKETTPRPQKPQKSPREPRTSKTSRVRSPRRRNPWNAPALEAALKETLFIRPYTADAYALHESRGYHRMGVRTGDVVLDIGAHIGCVASRCALVGAARVVSIEPEPENFTLLQQNTRSFTAVTCLQGAVYGGDQPTVQLHRVLRRNDGGHSTGTHSVLFKTRGDTLEVPRLDFWQLLKEHQPTVIKCDAEGAEFSLDWTELPASVRAVGIELHTRREQHRDEAKAIIVQLEAQGFRPVHRLNLDSNFSTIIAFLSRCYDTDGDGNCGQPACRYCSTAPGVRF